MQEAHDAVGDEIDSVSIFKGYLLALGIPDGSFIGMGSEFQHVTAFPKIVESATVLFWDWAQRGTVVVLFRSKMPFADVVGCVSGASEPFRERHGLWT